MSRPTSASAGPRQRTDAVSRLPADAALRVPADAALRQRAGAGPRRRADAGLRRRLIDGFVWRTDDGVDFWSADVTGWWRDPETLRSLGRGLAGLYDERPTVVVGPQSRGVLVGVLAASALGVGFVELRKEPEQATDSDRWVRRTAGPDYDNRQLTFGLPRRLLRSGDRVLMADDWIATGATARVARGLVEDCGARWIGAAVVVDALLEPRQRHELPVRALVNERDLR